MIRNLRGCINLGQEKFVHETYLINFNEHYIYLIKRLN